MATVKYNTKTGKRLSSGEKTTDARGNTFTEGKSYSSGLNSKSSPNLQPVPEYGKTVIDSQGRSGIAKFDPNTGKALLAPNPSSLGIGSSDSTRYEENNTNNQLDSLLRKAGITNQVSPESRKYNDMALREITKRQQQLESQYANMSSSINTSYDEGKVDLKDGQGRETGAQSSMLARIGGYLGGSASGQGAIINLERTHNQEVNALESKRQQALLSAEEARGEKSYQLTQSYIQQAQSFQKLVEDKKSQYFNQIMAVSQEQRQQQSAARENTKFINEQAEKELSYMIEAGKEVTGEDILGVSQALGISPDKVLGAVKAKQETLRLEKQDKRTDQEMQMISLLTKIPKGTYITINGKAYEGMEVQSGGGMTESDINRSIRNEFAADVRGGMSKKAAIDAYGGDLGVSYINEYYKATKSVDDDEKLSSGVFAVDNDGKKRFMYDKEAYKKSLEEWGKDGGSIFGNDKSTTFDGEKYKGKESDEPYISDYYIREIDL